MGRAGSTAGARRRAVACTESSLFLPRTLLYGSAFRVAHDVSRGSSCPAQVPLRTVQRFSRRPSTPAAPPSLAAWHPRCMPLVALTGGIASGKSTIARSLAGHGAVIVDADQIVRDVQQPGSPVLAAIAAEFGDGMLRPDGSLDRAALGGRVFGDADAVSRLNAIVHPAVRAESARRFAAAFARRPRRRRGLRRAASRRGARRATRGSSSSSRMRQQTCGARRLVDLRGMSETDAAARLVIAGARRGSPGDRRRRDRHCRLARRHRTTGRRALGRTGRADCGTRHPLKPLRRPKQVCRRRARGPTLRPVHGGTNMSFLSKFRKQDP